MKQRLNRWLAVLLVVLMLLGTVYTGGERVSAASPYPYLIKVNRIQCTITIYEKDKKGNYTVPVKAMLCSPGWDTPIGTFRTPSKYRWHTLMDDVYGQYCTRIYGGILFHSVWYYEQDPATLSNRQFNKLGTICSHGCIRINVQDAKWIYDNCPLGTTVVIYDDRSNPGPLGKPEAIKLPVSYGQGYDPTDIWTASNPYNKKKPVISGAKNRTVKYGSEVNIKQGITAKSTTGTDITSRLEATIEYDGQKVEKLDTKKTGIYKITYEVTDLLNRTGKAEAVITVEGSKAAPKLSGVKDLVVKGGTKVSRALVMKNVKATWEGRTLNKSSVKTVIKDISNEDFEVYEVTYTATAPNGRKKSKKILVDVDSLAPEFMGTEDREIAWDTRMDRAFALKGVTVSDDYSKMKKSDIKVTIAADQENHKYTVTYEAADQLGNRAKTEAVFTVTDFLRIEGAEDLSVAAGTAVTEEFALSQGVKAFDGEKDVSGALKAQVTEKEKDRSWEIVYSVTDAAGHQETVTVQVTAAGPENETGADGAIR